MGSGWARLGVAVVGAYFGYGWFGPIGMSVGFLAGSYLGNMIFPIDYESKMPPVHDYPVQSSAVGVPIPIIFGTTRLAGNVVWMGELVPYVVAHKGGGGKGGGDETTSYETRYRRSFLIAICEGPAVIQRAWKGKAVLNIAEFTSYDGDDNSGISILISEDYAEYSNLCLAYFEDYELGNSQALPNFIFEVSRGLLPALYGTGDKGRLVKWNESNAWEQVAPQLSSQNIFCLAEFNGKIYGGTHQGRLFEWNGINAWVEVAPRLNSINHIHALVVFNSKLYGAPDNGSLYEWNGTDAWVEVAPPIGALTVISLTVFNNKIYGGVGVTSGGQLFEWNGTDAWVEVAPLLDVQDYVYDLAVFNNKLYGGMGGGGTYEAALFEWNGTDAWVEVAPNAGNQYNILSLAVFNNKIYGGTYNLAQLYEWNGTDAWVFKAPRLNSQTSIFDLVVFNNKLYGGTGVPGNGGRLFEWNETDAWVEVAPKLSDQNAIYALLATAGGVETDMNFASMIKELLTNERFGGYDESDLITEDFNSIIAYCDTNDLKGSLAIADQKPLPDWIAYICTHFQGYFYEIGGKIGLNCYRVQNSVLNISQDDLSRENDEPPVHITKRPYSATFNRLEATWMNRDNNYKTAVVPAFDRIDQREAGQMRTKTMDLRAITNKELASKMAWRIFIDQIYRFSQYTFKLGYKSMLLEVGDVIDVTDGHLLVAQKMRVMSVSEEKDGRKALITAVEDISDFYPNLSYSVQESEATLDADITLIDGTIAFRENYHDNRLHLSIIPGGTQCNGFYIYQSYDDESYDLIGKAAIGGVTGGAANSTGTIQSNLPAYTTVVHRKDDAFDVSIGTITDLNTAITDDDFFNNRKLAKIGSEIIAYKTCVESAVEGTWRISNLIRGLFGTEPVAHIPNEVFNTLDTNFVYTLQQSDIGKTLYFKVVSFYADKIQLVSEVSSQSYAVSGKYMKPLPVSLMRINGREGLSTYRTADVTLDWYFCSKTLGFGRGGYGNALWGAYTKDPLLERLKVEVEEEDGTPIVDANYDLDEYGEPVQLEVLEADRNSKNPVRVKITPGSHLWSDDTRNILIEKI